MRSAASIEETFKPPNIAQPRITCSAMELRLTLPTCAPPLVPDLAFTDMTFLSRSVRRAPSLEAYDDKPPSQPGRPHDRREHSVSRYFGDGGTATRRARTEGVPPSSQTDETEPLTPTAMAGPGAANRRTWRTTARRSATSLETSRGSPADRGKRARHDARPPRPPSESTTIEYSWSPTVFSSSRASGRGCGRGGRLPSQRTGPGRTAGHEHGQVSVPVQAPAPMQAARHGPALEGTPVSVPRFNSSLLSRTRRRLISNALIRADDGKGYGAAAAAAADADLSDVHDVQSETMADPQRSGQPAQAYSLEHLRALAERFGAASAASSAPSRDQCSHGQSITNEPCHPSNGRLSSRGCAMQTLPARASHDLDRSGNGMAAGLRDIGPGGRTRVLADESGEDDPRCDVASLRMHEHEHERERERDREDRERLGWQRRSSCSSAHPGINSGGCPAEREGTAATQYLDQGYGPPADTISQPTYHGIDDCDGDGGGGVPALLHALRDASPSGSDYALLTHLLREEQGRTADAGVGIDIDERSLRGYDSGGLHAERGASTRGLSRSGGGGGGGGGGGVETGNWTGTGTGTLERGGTAGSGGLSTGVVLSGGAAGAAGPANFWRPNRLY
ncbi:hypothetical protein KEM52_006231 [Ascosphaera acerosa]|nr:hypothetical protein KEM52_006231 [Ascosphaera acerosa]